MRVRARGRLERLGRIAPGRLRVWLCAIVVIVMLGMISHGNYAGSGDAVHYMLIARSIAFDRDFDLGNDYRDPSNIVQVSPDDHARPGRNGVLRPVHDVGLPLIAAPFFGAAYRLAEASGDLPASLRARAKLNPFIALRQLMALFMIAVTATLAVVFFEALRSRGVRSNLAFAWVSVWTLSPPMLSHGYVFFTEVPSALLALLAYQQLDRLREARASRSVLFGLLCGLLFLVHARNVGLMAGLLLLAAVRVRADPRRGLGVAIGVSLLLACRVALNLDFWGFVLTNPHEHLGAWPGMKAYVGESAIRMLGLLFDARHGLLLSAPVYLLGPAAWLVLRRELPAAARELLLLVALYLLFVILPTTNIHGWRGGWSPAARFLVPIAPFLAFPVPWLLMAVRRFQALAVASVVLVQVGLDVFFWGHPMLLWSEGPGPAPFLNPRLGQLFAVWMPVVANLTASVLLACLAWLTAWLIFTRALAAKRAPVVRNP